MKKPMILVTARDEKTFQPILYSNKNYLDAIIQSGGIPFIYSYGNDESMDEIANRFDGLLVSGGGDIDPTYFNEPLDPTAQLVEPYVDSTDFALIKAFVKAGKPILGICRGIQMLNVAFGGTLYQDLNTSGLNLITDRHNQGKLNKERTDATHDVLFEKNSSLHAIFGDCYATNSYHHQALKQIGEGLKVVARCEDGVIEAIEGENIVAVQWHPEWLYRDEKHRRIFDEFIQRCQ